MLVAGLLLALVPTLAPQQVSAFDLDVHSAILHEALADQMTPEALDWVIGYYAVVFGSGNLGQDVKQWSPYPHFDNAPNPRIICERWKTGLDTYLRTAVQGATPRGAEKRELVDRKGALEAFGQATHAVADFYAHTNWVETMVVRGEPLRLAPILGTECDPVAFPSNIQSGYWDLGIFQNGIDGCPGNQFGPPRLPESFTSAGGLYCHAELTKDNPDAGRGHERALEGLTYHDLARELATRATLDVWESLHDRIIAVHGKDKATDPECLFMKLAWGGDRTCHRFWRVTGNYHARAETFITTHQFLPISNEQRRLYAETSVSNLAMNFGWEPGRYDRQQDPATSDAFEGISGRWTGVVQEVTSDGRAEFVKPPSMAKGIVHGLIPMVPNENFACLVVDVGHHMNWQNPDVQTDYYGAPAGFHLDGSLLPSGRSDTPGISWNGGMLSFHMGHQSLGFTRPFEMTTEGSDFGRPFVTETRASEEAQLEADIEPLGNEVDFDDLIAAQFEDSGGCPAFAGPAHSLDPAELPVVQPTPGNAAPGTDTGCPPGSLEALKDDGSIECVATPS